MKRLLLAGTILGLAVLALAQPIGPGVVLTGNELVNITLGSGSGAQVPLAQIRGANNIVTSAVTGGTITATNIVTTTVLTAALATPLVVNTPLVPFDGMEISIVNGTLAAFTQTITLTANPAASPAQTVILGPAPTLAAGTAAEWRYNAANTTWYRIR